VLNCSVAEVQVMHADALDALRELPDASVDAVVTDPPYEMGFMGRMWDASGIAYSVDLWREALRVLKPGGHLLAFGGTRTVHRLTSAIEDAGFEIRDGIDWLYGSGFPKSLDVSKAIDKAAGATRTEGGREWSGGQRSAGILGDNLGTQTRTIYDAPATDAAARWAGWGTALKPAREPIVVARKPLAGTVAANVLAYGTGALNIDACRVPATDKAKFPTGHSKATGAAYAQDEYSKSWTAGEDRNPAGRWPSNVVLSHVPLIEDGQRVGDACADGCVPGCPVAELDAQSGVLTSGKMRPTRPIGRRSVYGQNAADGYTTVETYGDTGGASRFFPVFRYQAKAPTRERPRVNGVAHPTVKPLALVRWLVRLVTPPGGVVLDPFAGSGTTAEACLLEGFRCIAVEREESYLPLIASRIERTKEGQRCD